MKYTMMLFVAVVLTALGLGAGCTKKSSSGNNAANSINPSQLYQTPNISGVLTNLSSNQVVMNISNLSGAGASGKSVLAPATLLLDLSASNASSGTAVSATVTSSNGSVSQIAGQPMKFNINFANPVLGSITVSVTDALGLVSTITFNVPVSCDPSKVAPIVFPSNPISVSAASSAGYVNVSVAAPSGGSGKGFSYAIDVNGDGRFDDYNNKYWNSSPSWSNIYNLYDGPRTVTVTALDSQCLIEQSVTQVINYQSILPPMQSGSSAVAESYFYLQGQVDPVGSNSDPAVTVHSFDAMDDGGQGAHVRCSYQYGPNGGALEISGFNVYSDGNSNDNSQLAQASVLDMAVPSDTGGMSSVTQSPATVTSLTYQDASSPDGNFSSSIFSKSAACVGSVTITKAPSAGTCATMPSNQVLMITMLGTYSCPSLSTGGSSSKSISMTKGYFYCQYDTANNCVGGGQEGGNPPPPF